MQVCPAFNNLPNSNLFAANLMLQFLSIIHGLFPPNSNVTGVKFLAAASITILPTFVPPV